MTPLSSTPDITCADSLDQVLRLVSIQQRYPRVLCASLGIIAGDDGRELIFEFFVEVDYVCR